MTEDKKWLEQQGNEDCEKKTEPKRMVKFLQTERNSESVPGKGNKGKKGRFGQWA